MPYSDGCGERFFLAESMGRTDVVFVGMVKRVGGLKSWNCYDGDLFVG